MHGPSSLSLLAVFLCFFPFLSLPLVFGLGIVTGGIYTDVPQSFASNASAIICEFQQLGVSHIRLEASWADTSPGVYQTIVQTAHSSGIAVIVLVNAAYCGNDTDSSQIDAFISSYIANLNSLVNNVFVGNSGVEALEIVNEPNVAVNQCGGGNTLRVSPNAFAWLLRRVYQWKQANGRPEKIISGAILDTYLTESYWPAFFGSGAFFGFQGSRPYDYFGIHPYNLFSLDENCINSNAGGDASSCFGPWAQSILSGVQDVKNAADAAAGVSDTMLFATEFGLQVSLTGSCPAVSTCVLSGLQQAVGMKAAVQALSSSGVVHAALWYDYRDDSSQTFGIRSGWTGSSYPARSETWTTFQALAGGSGNQNPDACW